ncbi:MAG: HlyD family efflux transporter periplasmic adaptor subunit, partial [Sedimentisphaerales bacterium]|nr:HlyD family efflux transporter periplasmic adaptor subunit [Sedimentisphaerales bacterium]
MKIQFSNRQKDPSVQHGVKVPYAPAKRKFAQWRWYLILLIVSSPLLYFLFKMGLSFVIVTAQGYISLDKIEVNSTVNGIVDTISVKPGQEVTAGAVIANLLDPDLSAQKRQAEAELTSLNDEQMLNSYAREQLLDNRVALTRRVLSSQKDYFQTMSFLFEQGAATLAELTTARERKDKAQADYDNAVYERQAYEEETLKQAAMAPSMQNRDQIRLEAQLKTIEERLARMAQITPYDGRILDIFASPGEALSPGSPIAAIGRSDRPYVVAYLNPKYAKYARIGQSARVTLPDGRKMNATVREDSQLTQRLPAHLISPIGSRGNML